MAIIFRQALFACPQCGAPVESYHDDLGDNPAPHRAPTHWTFDPCGHKFREFTTNLDTGIITRFIPFHPDTIERKPMATQPCRTCGRLAPSSRSMCPTCYQKQQPRPACDWTDELLVALKNAVSLWAFQSTDATQLAWLEEARAAIAKAEKGGA